MCFLRKYYTRQEYGLAPGISQQNAILIVYCYAVRRRMAQVYLRLKNKQPQEHSFRFNVHHGGFEVNLHFRFALPSLQV